MSIRLYNGFLIKDQNLQDFQLSLAQKRAVFRAAAVKTSHEKVAAAFVHTCDFSGFHESNQVGSSAFSLVQDILRDDLIESSVNGRKTYFDLESSLLVKSCGPHLLAMYFGPSHLEDQLKETFELTEFGYWNNTDEPEEMSLEEWKWRETVWESALPGWCSPLEAGFLCADLVRASEILSHVHEFSATLIPPKEVRISNCLKSIQRHVLTTVLDAQKGANYGRLRALEAVGKQWLEDASLEGVRLEDALRAHLEKKLPAIEQTNPFKQRYSLEVVDHQETLSLLKPHIEGLTSHLLCALDEKALGTKPS